MKLLSVFLFICVFLFSGCRTWNSLSDEKKIKTCQDTFMMIKPKCAFLEDKYAPLCESVADDAIKGCEAAILKDGSLMCERITAKADQCQLIPDDTKDRKIHVANCEHVIRLGGLLCDRFLAGDQVEVDLEEASVGVED